MSKYDPLRDHLMLHRDREFQVTFREIEKALGSKLPVSADRPQWWANIQDDSTDVQREAWRAAGYDAFLIVGSDKVQFRKSVQ